MSATTKWAKRLGKILVVLTVALIAIALAVGYLLRSSLPMLDGNIELEGLSENVTIERDALGVPTVTADNRLDVSRAIGFLHAQDRFFQMDLLRRSGAGELAELLGPALLPLDRRFRLHRFRSRAKAWIETAEPYEREVLVAYAEGVNAGLEKLGSRPFEYLVLRTDIKPWLPEDSFLVVLAMFFDLQDERGATESAYGVLHDVLPPELAHFLDPGGTSWDAPIEGEARTQPPIPPPEVYDLRYLELLQSDREAADLLQTHRRPARDRVVLGSNNWAVAGSRSASGHALLANDMHLGLRVPNTWYRLSMTWSDETVGGEHRITGVTLPGAPAVVVGSNGHVAWGFTNSYGDWADLVVLETSPTSPGDSYLTPEGSKKFETHREVILASDGQSEELEIESTIWGPVIDEDHRKRKRVLRWTAHLEGSVNVGFLQVEMARDLDSAMAAAHETGAPAQNFVVADSKGRVGWTLLGRIPRRIGLDGHLPTSWADGSRQWTGWLDSDEVPRVQDPPSGRVWTANARVVDGENLSKIGDGDYDLGARAQQIRDGLFALDKATADDLLAIQLDHRAIFLERWRDLLLVTLDSVAIKDDPRRQELLHLIETDWTGSASIDSAAYRLVRAFRLEVGEIVIASLLRECVQADERLEGWRPGQWEGPVWALLQERPEHLLDPTFGSWQDLLLAAVDQSLDYFETLGGALEEHTWGERNTIRIRHPLSAFLPFSSRWLDMPTVSLPGDSNLPRAQSPGFGASERLVVSPGHEEDGIFHMPSGQSGHPLSPFYRAGHDAWVEGTGSSFLPGETEHRLVLVP